MKNKAQIWFFSLLLSIVGVLDALYLSWEKLFNTDVFCGGSSSCETVNSSVYSELYGIPIAYLGFLLYFAIILILFLEKRKFIPYEISVFLLFGITFIGSLFSIYLTFIEFAVIKAICPYCFLSALIMLLLFTLNAIRLKPVLAIEYNN